MTPDFISSILGVALFLFLTIWNFLSHRYLREAPATHELFHKDWLGWVALATVLFFVFLFCGLGLFFWFSNVAPMQERTYAGSIFVSLGLLIAYGLLLFLYLRNKRRKMRRARSKQI